MRPLGTIDQIKHGSRIVYNDGRPGHSGIFADVLSVDAKGMTVQFEDRADMTRIAFPTALGWILSSWLRKGESKTCECVGLVLFINSIHLAADPILAEARFNALPLTVPANSRPLVMPKDYQALSPRGISAATRSPS